MAARLLRISANLSRSGKVNTLLKINHVLLIYLYLRELKGDFRADCNLATVWSVCYQRSFKLIKPWCVVAAIDESDQAHACRTNASISYEPFGANRNHAQHNHILQGGPWIPGVN